MYRERIREHYDRLSRSYRRVADFIMSQYYDVSFMTAAQLAQAVKVDTTTVVRFSQRLGYNGYPDLLTDVRAQVKDEIYTAYESKDLDPDDVAFTFDERVRQEIRNLNQMLIHNPPEHVRRIATLLEAAERILLVAEGYSALVASMIAQQLRHQGINAEAVDQDWTRRAATLTLLQDEASNATTLVVGVTISDEGNDVARVMQYARLQGCPTLGLVGSLSSPVNRASDAVLYAPSESAGPIPSVVGLVTALSAIVQICGRDNAETTAAYIQDFRQVYRFLADPQAR